MKFYRTNKQITALKVRLIDENGVNVGTLETSKAIESAREKGLDLMELDPTADPPIAKIVDFSQFKYNLLKKQKKERKLQKSGGVKGIRLSSRIGQHDLELKVEKAKEFIAEGHKVQAELFLRGREKLHADLAEKLIKQFIELLGENIIIEQPLKRQGGRISALVVKKNI